MTQEVKFRQVKKKKQKAKKPKKTNNRLTLRYIEQNHQKSNELFNFDNQKYQQCYVGSFPNIKYDEIQERKYPVFKQLAATALTIFLIIRNKTVYNYFKKQECSAKIYNMLHKSRNELKDTFHYTVKRCSHDNKTVIFQHHYVKIYLRIEDNNGCHYVMLTHKFLVHLDNKLGAKYGLASKNNWSWKMISQILYNNGYDSSLKNLEFSIYSDSSVFKKF